MSVKETVRKAAPTSPLCKFWAQSPRDWSCPSMDEHTFKAQKVKLFQNQRPLKKGVPETQVPLLITLSWFSP